MSAQTSKNRGGDVRTDRKKCSRTIVLSKLKATALRKIGCIYRGERLGVVVFSWEALYCIIFNLIVARIPFPWSMVVAMDDDGVVAEQILPT